MINKGEHMQISVTNPQDIAVLSLNGRLDHKGASLLDDTLNALPDSPSHVVLEMRQVDYVSSMGIRSLMNWHKKLKIN